MTNPLTGSQSPHWPTFVTVIIAVLVLFGIYHLAHRH
jgi:hypothetical protein